MCLHACVCLRGYVCMCIAPKNEERASGFNLVHTLAEFLSPPFGRLFVGMVRVCLHISRASRVVFISPERYSPLAFGPFTCPREQNRLSLSCHMDFHINAETWFPPLVKAISQIRWHLYPSLRMPRFVWCKHPPELNPNREWNLAFSPSFSFYISHT